MLQKYICYRRVKTQKKQINKNKKNKACYFFCFDVVTQTQIVYGGNNIKIIALIFI